MNETHATKYLIGLPCTEMPGTAERTRRLLSQMGDVHKSISIIKILGEAGKGSASSLVASLMASAGIRTGVLTLTPQSEPRLAIRIENEPPSHVTFAKAVTAAWSAAREIGLEDPTYEEMLLSAALVYFANESCRTVILVLPKDQRLTATSALPPSKLCLLTSTSGELASALVPLIDTAGDLVSAPQEPRVYRLLTERAAQTHCRLSFPTKNDVGEATVQNGNLRFSYRGTPYSLPTLAYYQRDNALAVIETYHALVRQGFRLTENDLENALATPPSALSFRLFSLSPAWLIDAADTPLRLRALADSLDKLPAFFDEPLTVWTEPRLAEDVCRILGDRIATLRELEPGTLRRAVKKNPPPKGAPLLAVGAKPFAAEALRALSDLFLYS